MIVNCFCACAVFAIDRWVFGNFAIATVATHKFLPIKQFPIKGTSVFGCCYCEISEYPTVDGKHSTRTKTIDYQLRKLYTKYALKQYIALYAIGQ